MFDGINLTIVVPAFLVGVLFIFFINFFKWERYINKRLNVLYDDFERVSSCSDFMLAIQGKVENDAKRIAEARAVWEDYLHRVDGALNELPALVQGNIATEIAEAHKIFNSLREFLDKIQREVDMVKNINPKLCKFKNGKDGGRDIRKLVRRYVKEEFNSEHVENKIYNINVKLKEADLLGKKGLEKSIELRSNFNELYSELQTKYNDITSQLNSSLGDYIEAKIIALTSAK